MCGNSRPVDGDTFEVIADCRLPIADLSLPNQQVWNEVVRQIQNEKMTLSIKGRNNLRFSSDLVVICVIGVICGYSYASI